MHGIAAALIYLLYASLVEIIKMLGEAIINYCRGINCKLLFGIR